MTSYRIQQQKRSKSDHEVVSATVQCISNNCGSSSSRDILPTGTTFQSPSVAAQLPRQRSAVRVLHDLRMPPGLQTTTTMMMLTTDRRSRRTVCCSTNFGNVQGRPWSTAGARAAASSSRTTGAVAWSVFVVVVLFTVASCGVGTARAAGFPGSGSPCVFEGHLKTDRNWYGYLANISFVTTARMTFEFTYPADRCCQTILFYTSEQTSIINARMNCWNKEYLLRPEDDQVLRLTPRFAWSGCHMVHPGGLSTYHCEGGRSFTADQSSGNAGVSTGGGGSAVQPPSLPGPPGAPQPSTWYIAVSNCGALHGLELRYRMAVYGHVGDCPPSGPASGAVQAGLRLASGSEGTGTALGMSSSDADGSSDGGAADADATPNTRCHVVGEINSTSSWHGFIANASLARGGGYNFRFSFPMYAGAPGGGSADWSSQSASATSSKPRTISILLYTSDDVAKLSPDLSCWQKYGIIRHRNALEQVIELSSHSSYSACVTSTVTSGSSSYRQVSCRGERRYNGPQRLYFAVSDCPTPPYLGLQLHYDIEFYGFTNYEELCSTAAISSPINLVMVSVVATSTAAILHLLRLSPIAR